MGQICCCCGCISLWYLVTHSSNFQLNSCRYLFTIEVCIQMWLVVKIVTAACVGRLLRLGRACRYQSVDRWPLFWGRTEHTTPSVLGGVSDSCLLTHPVFFQLPFAFLCRGIVLDPATLADNWPYDRANWALQWVSLHYIQVLPCLRNHVKPLALEVICWFLGSLVEEYRFTQHLGCGCWQSDRHSVGKIMYSDAPG